MPKNIIVTEKADESVKPYVDPYMSILPAYRDLDFYLLAAACMLEQELPGKVAIYGDITRGQCKKAAEMAADLLGGQIELPDRCDLQGLHDRGPCFRSS